MAQYHLSSRIHRSIYILYYSLTTILLFFLWFQVELIPWFFFVCILFLALPRYDLVSIQFEKGQCFFYFDDYVLNVEIHAIHFFRLGWLMITNRGRYFLFLDALSQNEIHQLLWKMRQITRR